MRYIDLFGGIGGFRYGIERATKGKWKCVYYADIDRYATAVYNYNFHEHWEPTDITKVEPESIPEADLICAGFPCQSFSLAGKRKGFEDTRGTLYHEILRIARAKRIKYLFLENVKGLLNHDEGATFGTILQSLDESGYDAQWQVLNSKWWVPQNRERVFIVANLREESRPQIFPIGESYKETDEQGGGLAQQSLPTVFSDQYKIGRGMPMIMRMDANESVEHRVYDSEGISPTLPTGSTGGNLIPKILSHYPRSSTTGKGGTGLRASQNHSFAIDRTPNFVVRDKIEIWRETPIECERLQGFPDNWTKEPNMSDTQRYKMCGNAVTTSVITAIVEKWMINS